MKPLHSLLASICIGLVPFPSPSFAQETMCSEVARHASGDTSTGIGFSTNRRLAQTIAYLHCKSRSLITYIISRDTIVSPCRPTGCFDSPARTPTIYWQTGGGSVPAGSELYFRCFGSGDGADAGPLQYRWYFNNSLIPTETGPTLSIPGGILSESEATHAISCVVENRLGQGRCDYESTITAPSANEKPYMISSPRNLTIQFGETATFHCLVGGGVGPLSYTWYANDQELGVGPSSVTFTTITEEDDGATVRCSAADQNGDSAFSERAILTVLPRPTPQPTPTPTATPTQSNRGSDSLSLSTQRSRFTTKRGRQLSIKLTIQSIPSNGVLILSASGLPPGMTFDKRKKELRGRPTRTGTYRVSIRAQQNKMKRTLGITIVVNR